MVSDQGWHKCTVPTASSLFSYPVETPFSPESRCQARVGHQLPPAASLLGFTQSADGNTVVTCTESSSVVVCCSCHLVKSIRSRHMLMLQSTGSRSCGMEEGGCRTEVGSMRLRSSSALLYMGAILRGSFTFVLFCKEQTRLDQSINAAGETKSSNYVQVQCCRERVGHPCAY